MPDLLDEVRDLLAAEWPDYARYLDDHRPEVAEVGVLFVHRLLDLAEHGPRTGDSAGEGVPPPTQLVFEQVGRQQLQDGADLSDLLGAYQVGARAAWHHVAETALKLDLGPEVLAVLAEAVFAFVDEFSAASAHGYVLEQSASSAARERHREELAEMLLSGRSDTIGIRLAAERAGWQLPPEVAVVLADPADARSCGVVEHLGGHCLPIRRDDAIGAIVPSPMLGGRITRLVAALRGCDAVIGHPLTLDLLPTGMRIARTALRLRKAGVLSGSPVVVAEELDTIIANRDEWLLETLRAQVLQPLRELPDGKRDRLVETLRSWLWNMGDRHAVADDLHIHPQTVRYRMDRLHDLLGERLDSPRERARMYLALVWDQPHGRAG
ncbi:PucR family transcriptional regulator [Nocardia aobensis]|uniref:PucR family transcriptional regulator n=1 Tax=Nocardia aobensis TaxID=257277 RepID=UPI0003008C66|nr:helix-turn-helix domain-containing protein [Nocardia aobensis]